MNVRFLLIMFKRVGIRKDFLRKVATDPRFMFAGGFFWVTLYKPMAFSRQTGDNLFLQTTILGKKEDKFLFLLPDI